MTEQLGLGGMPQRLFMATPTRLTTWLDCPNRYRLTYLDKAPKGPPWAHNSVGLSVHNALRDWFGLPVETRTVEAAGTLVRRGWIGEGFRDDAQSAQWRERAARMVGRYVDGLDPADEPVGVERTVAFRTRTLAMSGRADRIDERVTDSVSELGGELVVVDYKTGRHLLSTDDARSSLALAMYAVASARTLRRPCRRVELHHLPSGHVVAWEHDEVSLRRHVGRAEDIAAEAQTAEASRTALLESGADPDDAAVAALFPARPGPMCGYCDMVRSCPTGIAEIGGVLTPSWDVLDRWSDEDPDVTSIDVAPA